MIVSLETEFWEELENCVQPKYTKWHLPLQDVHYRDLRDPSYSTPGKIMMQTSFIEVKCASSKSVTYSSMARSP